MVSKVFKKDWFGSQKPSWFLKWPPAGKKTPKSSFSLTAPLIYLQDQRFGFHSYFLKNGLKPFLYPKCHRNWYSILQIWLFGSSKDVHPPLKTTTYPPKTLKPVPTPLHFLLFSRFRSPQLNAHLSTHTIATQHLVTHFATLQKSLTPNSPNQHLALF